MEVTKNKEQAGQSPEGKRPEIDPAIVEQLMKDYQRPEDLTGPGGIMEQLTKRLYERVLGAEMTHYLGYEKGQAPKADQQRENHRNGTSKKRIVSEDGKLEIEVPRDRADQIGRYLHLILLFQEGSDLPHRHALGIHGDNLGIESSKAALPLADKPWLELPSTVAGYLDL